jgi:hypothetical protein
VKCLIYGFGEKGAPSPFVPVSFAPTWCLTSGLRSEERWPSVDRDSVTLATLTSRSTISADDATSETQRKGREQLHHNLLVVCSNWWDCTGTECTTVGQLCLYCTITSNVGRLGMKQQSTWLYKNHFSEELWFMTRVPT